LQITGTHIAYYHLCYRKLWLFANGINMEHTSDVVGEGKLIGVTSYQDRASKFTEIEIDGVKIDFYDAKNRVIHEVKKSDCVEQAHFAQVKYYIYKLRQKGIEDVTGIIEYPKLRQREQVSFDADDEIYIQQWVREVENIIHSERCPEVIRSKICKSCSYYDFCYSTE
jgi:CRISPR-associated exonuclease Cas4